MKDSQLESLPLVSVCIPTYNRARMLERAVGSLLAGEYGNLEIIISDNASQDDTRLVGERLGREHPQVRYFRHSVNQGPTANFEFARQQVRGKYFLWHGDDDYLDSSFIRVCVEALEKDESLVLASGLAAYHRNSEAISHYGNIIDAGAHDPVKRISTYLWHVSENSIFCGAYRVSKVSACSMPNCLAGDWIWMCDVLLQGRAVVIPTVHVHREFGETTSNSLKRIVEVLRLPAWNARFPGLAMLLCFTHFMRLAVRRSGLAFLARQRVVLAVQALVFLRALRMNIAPLLKKTPLLRGFYRTFKARMLS